MRNVLNKKKTEVEVLPVVDLSAESAPLFFFGGRCNTGETGLRGLLQLTAPQKPSPSTVPSGRYCNHSSCSDATYPTIWVFLLWKAFFAAGCTLARETTRPESERGPRGLLQPMAPQYPTHNGSAEGRWRFIFHAVCLC